MELENIIEWLNNYGFLLIFIISFLEHLNVPLLAAGIVYPAFGLWVKIADSQLVFVIIVSVAGSFLATLALYLVARFFEPKIRRFCKKFPRIYAKIEEYEVKLLKNAFKVNFFAKLLPLVRTLMPIPCGFVKMNINSFIVSSLSSLALYNAFFVLLGYFLSYTYFEWFS